MRMPSCAAGHARTRHPGKRNPREEWVISSKPEHPALASYWAGRRQKVKPPLDAYTLRLLTKQKLVQPQRTPSRLA